MKVLRCVSIVNARSIRVCLNWNAVLLLLMKFRIVLMNLRLIRPMRLD